MAAAEVRTAWQRAANRYFVQEDAKRAPKLACCQSSSPSSRQVDSGPTSPVDGPECFPSGLMPFTRNPSHGTLPSDASWWLQLDPSYYCYQRGFTYEQVKCLKTDYETKDVKGSVDSKAETMKPDSEASVNHPSVDWLEKQTSLDVERTASLDCKVDQDVLDVKDLTDYYEQMEMEMFSGSAVSKMSNELSCNLGTQWVDDEGKVPWWRKTDIDELASMVAEKSLQHIENCDLPPPQKMHVSRKEACKQRGFIEREVFSLSQASALSGLWSENVSVSACKRGSECVSPDHLVQRRVISKQHMSTTEDTHSNQTPGTGSSSNKAQLIEALCHSQTRARVAENAAKLAHAEKDHVVKLFFKQASQLFAYKQLVRLLQLESSCLHSTKEHHHKTAAATTYLGRLVDDMAPWISQKQQSGVHAKVRRKNRRSRLNNNRRKQGCDVCRYAVVFALGMGLVGAGLILGWTVGWLFSVL